VKTKPVLAVLLIAASVVAGIMGWTDGIYW
jgi:hypothetical protein